MAPSRQELRQVAMSQEYDTLIRNALVFDGQGSPPEQVDVAIEAGKIAAIGSLDAAVAKEEMSVDGLACRILGS